jgi:hypothetical protein
MRSLLVAAVVAALLVPAASAKDFRPGDLSICNATQCEPVMSRRVSSLLGAFYYQRPVPATVARPRLGTPYYELRFDNGYVTGIVATRRLDRFLSYGVHLGHFQRDRWHALPPRAAADLRLLAASLRPLRLTRAALARSR